MENETMKIYEIRLKSLGNITSLPDSQKIFGAIVHTFMSQNPEATFELDKIIKLTTKEGKTTKIAAISNLFPVDHLPNLYFWGEQEKNAYSTEIKYKIKNQRSKKYTFFNEDYKNSYKNNAYIKANDQTNELEINQSYRDMNNFQQAYVEQEGGVFSQNVLEIINESAPEEYDFVFYIKGHNIKFKKLIFKLGPRTSRGFNLYKVVKQLELINMNEYSQKFINIGMLGGNNFKFLDQEKSGLKTYLSERKAYDFEKDKQVLAVNYIDVGSLIVLNRENKTEDLEVAVKIKDTERYLYTGGFLLPLTIVKGEKNE